MVSNSTDVDVSFSFVRSANELQIDRTQRSRKSKTKAERQLVHIDDNTKHVSSTVQHASHSLFPPAAIGTVTSVTSPSRSTCSVSTPPPVSTSIDIALLSTTLSDDQQQLLEKFVAFFHLKNISHMRVTCRIVNKFSDMVTHVIVNCNNDDKILHSRTMKYFQGLIRKYII